MTLARKSARDDEPGRRRLGACRLQAFALAPQGLGSDIDGTGHPMTAVLRCFVDDETLKWLEKASIETGRNIEQLAEAAIENAAIEYKVSRMGTSVPRGESKGADASTGDAPVASAPTPSSTNQRCPKCDGEGFINRHANLPDELCPACSVTRPQGKAKE